MYTVTVKLRAGYESSARHFEPTTHDSVVQAVEAARIECQWEETGSVEVTGAGEYGDRIEGRIVLPGEHF